MLNFLTPERTAAAAALVRRGATFNLDYPINAFMPPMNSTRHAAEHHIFANDANHRDDWLDSFYLQSTSQVDALRHIRHHRYGFYGGVGDDSIAVGTPDLGVQQQAEKAIAGRGVLLDAVRYGEAIGDPIAFGALKRFTPAYLDRMADHFDVDLLPGDLVLLRTGFAEQWLAMTRDERRAAMSKLDRSARGQAGIDQSDEMLAWIWNHQLSMLAADNGAVESWPINPGSGWFDPDEPPPPVHVSQNGMIHRPLIGLLGLVLGELWKLDELAADCAADGVYEFMVTVKPLNLLGGVGSPPNAIAIK
ncbi:MAG: cyclase family protein [Alphaproteobacteria bacterium]|nr:cyclase family protein [Alphaproteobacteria bacterium]